MKDKRISFRVSSALRRRIISEARKNKRSVSDWIVLQLSNRVGRTKRKRITKAQVGKIVWDSIGLHND